MAGQIKALSMIVAIEGLIPNPDHARRSSSSGTQPVAPPVKAQICRSQWLNQQPQAAAEEPPNPVAAAETRPAAPQPAPNRGPNLANDMSTPNLGQNQPSVANPFINPERRSPVPAATDYVFDAVLDTASPLRLSFSPQTGFSGRRP
jgi:hypothetical protein